MSLNFDSTKCNPPLPVDEKDSTLREVLIWGSMATGIPEITEKNFMEVYARIHVEEKINGTWRIVEGKDNQLYVTADEVKRWIGLHTNVSPITRAQFLKRLSVSMDRIVKRGA